MPVADLDLELDVFAGPFDLLIAVLLREEVDLMEIELAEVVVAYVEHLEREGELELEVATEFLVLIAALLELKSRLLLPGADPDLEELGPEEAVEELLARLLEYRRYPAAGRRQPHPPDRLPGAAAARPARRPLRPRQHRLRRAVRRRGPADPGGHPVRPARALPQGRDHLEAGQAARPDRDHPPGGRVSDLSRTIEALLFLSPEPVAVADLVEATESSEGRVSEAIELLREDLAEGRRGVVLREVGGGFALASDPASEAAARRLLAKPRTPPLTQAQAETLAIVAYLQPVSRPEVARIRGVSSESAVQTLSERGLIEESGRSQFGAALFKTCLLYTSDAADDLTRVDLGG